MRNPPEFDKWHKLNPGISSLLAGGQSTLLIQVDCEVVAGWINGSVSTKDAPPPRLSNSFRLLFAGFASLLGLEFYPSQLPVTILYML